MAEDWGVQSDFAVLNRLIRVDGRFIVDAGCGGGRLCRKLAESGAIVLGVEPDPVQAEKNRAADVVPNVSFAQASAAQIPVEPQSVDGIIFGNSLHHVPARDYELVFDEVHRILKPDGFLYVQEPVATGSHQDVMELFHDETEVRLRAYRALVKMAHPAFDRMREVYYDVERSFESFDAFADHYSHLSYNAGKYDGDRVRNNEVKGRFEQHRDVRGGGYTLIQPMRVNCYSTPR